MNIPIASGEVARHLSVQAHDIVETAPAAKLNAIPGVASQFQDHTQLYLDTLLTYAPFGFVFLDRDLRFVRINDQLAEINGYSVAAHIGKTVGEIVPTLEATLREVTAQIIASGQPVLDHEFTGETARVPGITRTWNESWYPVRDSRGEIIGFSAMVVDITERKQAEAALRLQNDRFELAVKASQAVLWQQDLDLRFTWLYNPASGIDGANAVGKREADLLERAEDVATIERLKHEVMRSGVGMRTEFSPQIQGVVHCFELLMEPLTDAAGHITGLTGVAIDITERKNAEAAQRESSQYYRALAEASLEIPYRMSADWSTMQVLNGGDLVASSDGPLADWAWLEQNLPREEHARVRQAISDAIARVGLFEMEHRVLRPNGSTGWVRSRAVPLLDENKVLVAWFGAASDITDRKHSEERLRLAIAGSDLGTWHWDIRTDQLDWSERCLAIFGFPARTAMTYEKFLGALHPEDRARAEDTVQSALQNGSEYRIELRSVWPDGSVHWALSLGRAYYDAAGEPTRMEGIALDITERKKIEQNLIKATAIAEKANRAKSDFLSAMSHELRTPLNSILGFAQLLEADTPEPSPAQRQKIEHILKGGWYLLELVNELLDLAQIESGKLNLAHEPFMLTEVMIECQTMVEPLARERAITLTFPAVGLPGHMCADRTRVKQILINLLSNAIKYNKPQGEVNVAVKLGAADTIRVSIQDTGEGLESDKLAQLFQPFNRLGKETGPEQGTGIGLAMTKHLVEAMGGVIGVESEVGVGSVFWFELEWLPHTAC